MQYFAVFRHHQQPQSEKKHKCTYSCDLKATFATKGRLTVRPRLMGRMAQFPPRVLLHDSLLVFLPAQTFAHLNISKTCESLMGLRTAAAAGVVQEAIVVSEVLLHIVIRLIVDSFWLLSFSF